MSSFATLPCRPDEIDSFLARPTAGVLDTLKRYPGDLLVVGASGKMGPTLCLMLKQALEKIGSRNRVLAVARFSDAQARKQLNSHGVETIPCDLLDRKTVAQLPEAPNVFFLAGQKFGTTAKPDLTWAMNTLVPANVAERYAKSRIVAFSTGCVYSFTSLLTGGSREDAPTQPVGDYANSCLARERIFTHLSRTNATPVTLYRLNYAIDFRYGVLVDVALKVLQGEPVDVTMGHVNLIWQGDACARAIQCLDMADSPAVPMNITGPETVSIRALAMEFGRRFGKEAIIQGREEELVWLNNAAKSFELWGYPEVSLGSMMDWVTAWLSSGGKTLGKPTHFETRSGAF